MEKFFAESTKKRDHFLRDLTGTLVVCSKPGPKRVGKRIKIYKNIFLLTVAFPASFVYYLHRKLYVFFVNYECRLPESSRPDEFFFEFVTRKEGIPMNDAEMIKKPESEKKFPTRPVAPLGVIAMNGCETMGSRVNDYLLRWQIAEEPDSESAEQSLHSFYGTDKNGFLLEASCPRFGTGEAKGMLKGTVRGYDLFIICDIGAYQCTYKLYGKDVPMTPDEHYADLKRIIAAASGKAYRINVIMPMLYEGRQHRRSSRESLDCALMLQELVGMGVSNIITFDAHDPRVQNAIPLHGFESIMPTYQMLKAMCRTYTDLRFDREHMMVISPDEGALNRNIYYSSALGVDMGMFYKRRDYTRVVNGSNPIIAHEYLGDSVEGKDIFVADDIIASGDSILDLAQNLKGRGAHRVFAGADVKDGGDERSWIMSLRRI